jgi:hypothetical protein
MARLLFECEDREGYRVLFETSDKDAKELLSSYETSKQWLLDNGFTLAKAQGTKPLAKAKEKVRFDGTHCPQCNGALWDNRQRKEGDPTKSKWPDFSCRDKTNCKWAVWPGQYEIVANTA